MSLRLAITCPFCKRPMATSAAFAGQTIACNAIDPVAQEGMQAFVEKRKPNWNA